MTKINTILLLSIFVLSCLRPVTRTEIVPVNLPAPPCEVPFPPPAPEVSKAPYDCDGPGPESTVCMHEPDFVQVIVWLKKWIAWSEVIEKCPGVKFSDDWQMKPPAAVHTPVQEQRI